MIDKFIKNTKLGKKEEQHSTRNSTLPINAAFWDSRYKTNETGWDLKQVSPPIKAYIDQLTNKKVKVLIAGCGNAYEAEYLYQQGFQHITLVDISAILVDALKEKFKDTPIKIICQDIFEHQGKYDLIIEQTLFCALDPSLRKKYAATMNGLLKEKGKLVGLLFSREFEQEGPPFGGTVAEYKELFNSYFQVNTMEDCYNSIAPRANTEVFINFSKK